MTDPLAAVIGLVSGVLEVPAAEIGPDASMETIAAWDSLAQLNICMEFAQRFNVPMEMTTIAEATSIAKLRALLP